MPQFEQRVKVSRSVAVLAVLLLAACAPPPIRSTLQRPLSSAEVAQLWIARETPRALDLFHGPGGPGLAPPPRAGYLFLEKDTAGYSDGYDVVGPGGLEWGVKDRRRVGTRNDIAGSER